MSDSKVLVASSGAGGDSHGGGANSKKGRSSSSGPNSKDRPVSPVVGTSGDANLCKFFAQGAIAKVIINPYKRRVLQVRRKMALRSFARRRCGRRLQQDAMRSQHSRTKGLQAIMSTKIAGTPPRGVSFQEYLGMVLVEVDSEMLLYMYGERRRPVPKPKGLMSTGEARMAIDVRDHLRAIRKGKQHALQVDPSGALSAT